MSSCLFMAIKTFLRVCAQVNAGCMLVDGDGCRLLVHTGECAQRKFESRQLCCDYLFSNLTTHCNHSCWVFSGALIFCTQVDKDILQVNTGSRNTAVVCSYVH